MDKILKMLKENGIKCHLEGNAIVVEGENGDILFVYGCGEFEINFELEWFGWPSIGVDEEPKGFEIYDNELFSQIGFGVKPTELVSWLKKISRNILDIFCIKDTLRQV